MTIRPLALALSLLAVAPAHAALTAVYVVENEWPAAPTGFVVNGIDIDFEGELGAMRLLVDLSSGAVYNHSFGGVAPPSPTFFDVVPELMSDSFVAAGGYYGSNVYAGPGSSYGIVVDGDWGPLVTNSAPSGPGEGRLDVTWQPADNQGPVVIDGGSNFPIAQLTLSEDAAGAVRLEVEAGGERTIIATGFVSSGVVHLLIPEPSSILLAVTGVAYLASTRRFAV